MQTNLGKLLNGMNHLRRYRGEWGLTKNWGPSASVGCQVSKSRSPPTNEDLSVGSPGPWGTPLQLIVAYFLVP